MEGMEGVGASGGNVTSSAGFSSWYVISRGGIDVGVEAFGAVGKRRCSVCSTGLSGMGLGRFVLGRGGGDFLLFLREVVPPWGGHRVTVSPLSGMGFRVLTVLLGHPLGFVV